jgi:hypothetical protein
MSNWSFSYLTDGSQSSINWRFFWFIFSNNTFRKQGFQVAPFLFLIFTKALANLRIHIDIGLNGTSLHGENQQLLEAEFVDDSGLYF